ncbi:hypothetical protein [Mycoplasma suis]|uniref:Uncharacterized protein n=1 Tax=Mycoplasma suis (strain KI_3806) TaxID=708248 RepID=F0V300_MYCS3|nr:hypothetical protein [Mycoplasma suis]CBZ40222.1 hypothetical protein MSUIS_01290 [Mycoplasma suis KI3806]
MSALVKAAVIFTSFVGTTAGGLGVNYLINTNLDFLRATKKSWFWNYLFLNEW